MEPVAFIDGLVKGVVLIAYDFARMTCLGVCIPFVRNTRRFWPALLSEQKYLSPLTYLVFWVLLTAALALRSGVELASNVAGFEKSVVPSVTTTIVLALAFSILADLICRIPLFRLKGVRRRLYDGLMRIAVANVFVAACVVMIFSPILTPHHWVDTFGPFYYLDWSQAFTEIFNLGAHSFDWVPHPLIFLFSASLGILLVKAISIRKLAGQMIVGTLFALAVPILLFKLSLPIARLVYANVGFLSEAKIYPAQVPCNLEANQIRIKGYLRLEGAKTILLRAERLVVFTEEDPLSPSAVFVSKIDENQGDVVVSDSTYTPIALTSKYDPRATTVQLNQGEFGCSLRVHEENFFRRGALKYHYARCRQSNKQLVGNGNQSWLFSTR